MSPLCFGRAAGRRGRADAVTRREMAPAWELTEVELPVEAKEWEAHVITRALSKTLYGVFGVIYLVAGGSVLLLGTSLLPDAVRDIIVNVSAGNGNTLHIMQEFGSILIFVGLITLWFLRHYDQSRPFHWAMTVFWGLFALIHWFDVRGAFQPGIGPAINTVPLSLFVVVGLLRQGSEGRAKSG